MSNLLKLKDTLTPDLTAKLRAAKNRVPMLRAMGQAVKAVAITAFTAPELRPSTWAPRKDPKKTHALLQLSTLLRKSPRVTSWTADSVTIGSDRPYAAAHQLGSDKNNLPPRPFFPFYPSGSLTPEGAKRVERALKAALKASGL
jgi:phage gpG-like protein